MNRITVAGAGAFGTALAISIASERSGTTLWARDRHSANAMQASRFNTRYLPDHALPDALTVSSDTACLENADIVLLAVPTQHLRSFLVANRPYLSEKSCVICCKGIEKNTGLLPSSVVQEILPDTKISILTGPGFAAEIAAGLPTALTLAATLNGPKLQSLLSTKCLRLYLSDDPTGAQLGGALKNVFAIGSGIAIGVGLGESARAAVMTRGYAEMVRLATDMGANPSTLAGLSGLGDLALTCTSHQSRNFALGLSLAKGGEQVSGTTVEGVATAQATLILGQQRGIEMPITSIVASVLQEKLTIPEAVEALMSRPLRSE